MAKIPPGLTQTGRLGPSAWWRSGRVDLTSQRGQGERYDQEAACLELLDPAPHTTTELTRKNRK